MAPGVASSTSAGLGRGSSEVEGWRERSDARRRRKGSERDRREGAMGFRRRRGSLGLDEHEAEERDGLRRRHGGRSEHPFRRARARDGGNRERPGVSRRSATLRRDVFLLLRLHAAFGPEKGAYVLAEASGGAPRLLLIGTGSEVSLALEAREKLEAEGIPTRVVSMPSWELFGKQPRGYRDSVFPPSVGARLSIEAGSTFGWERWVGDRGASIGLERFGASAPGEVVLRELGFNVDNVVDRAKALL